MTVVSPTQVHTVAVVGSGGSGKTLLAEALLVAAGAIPKLGAIEDTVIDTPGSPDFVTEAELAVQVADLAVLVVSAVDGVEVQTEAAWRLLVRSRVPFVVFVNKLDAERADYEGTLEGLRAAFGDVFAAVELPFADTPGHTAIADLLEEVAILEDHGAVVTAPIPPELAEVEHRRHDELVEGIVVADADLMAR